MENRGHPHTLSGRVDETQLAKVDAAAVLTRQARSHFVVQAALERADEVLRGAVGQMATSAGPSG